MKATLEFNLPKEQPEHLTAVMSGYLFSALWDIDNLCRSVIRHDTYKDKTPEDLAETIREVAGEVLSKLEQ